MTSPTPDKKSAPKSSFKWLSTGFICLLIGGTIAAKMVFLIDDDLEIKTKFAGKSWQLNSQSVKKEIANLEISTRQYLQPLWANIQQQSHHSIDRMGNALASQNWCVNVPKSLDVRTKIDSDPAKPSKIDRKQHSTTSDSVDRKLCLK